MTFHCVPSTLAAVRHLFETYHGYHSVGKVAVAVYAVLEESRIVAAYVWNLPALGVAKKVCPEAPHAVLALTRMVALPKTERRLKHISKPLKYQMKHLLDRTRYPVLITFSDEGQGHNGFVYQCSGWTRTERTSALTCTVEGMRVSKYSNGRTKLRGDIGETTLQRWENRACPLCQADSWLASHGWTKETIPNKFWRSGNPACRWVKCTTV